MNPTAENILKLAALATVVDGQASEQEKNFIVDDGSYLLRTSPDEVRPFIDLCIRIYQSKGAANNPGTALNFALEALKPLTDSEKHLAFHICYKVIHIDKEVKESEMRFFFQLHRLVFS
ncbi:MULTISPECIES: hypothetical protein [Okeania]|uniref:TerB family tellurite resistance protein n=3 Tax=Okeania TaxID=1458928 RepID=A0A3N6P2B6_9CYAN|nr:MULTISPECIES: hypothetical protein [Okeania]NET12101.1 hypothetical protein [Okeania sp. SIO1H6]NES75249.1 hypothetical protein [Okeania sp. SIO1H4]NET19291.1 hypothetical protein [Okeania sp. SIO1H5]NET75908.1 hypothetical protein [Okeania sp. SIO1F9]NET92886.1 hypothetical protein [Okeania sp. SIO1H2]